MKWVTAEQGTPEWHAARLGCLTASRMADAQDRTKSGADSSKRRGLKLELLAESLTGMAEQVFVNKAMQWGTDTEPQARGAYALATGNDVELCGFALHDSIPYFGASPDGLIGTDGLLEIKCPNSTTHLETVMGGIIPEKHVPQMLTQLAVTGRSWCDFVSFDPRIKREEFQLFIRRFSPGPAQIDAVEAEARQIAVELEEMFQKVKEGI